MMENRTIFQSLDKAWDLLSLFPKEKLNKINRKLKDEFYEREKRLYDLKRNGQGPAAKEDDPNQIKS